ncbi:MAG: PDZ domain-containing protein [Verrucomicrobiales bacterium]
MKTRFLPALAALAASALAPGAFAQGEPQISGDLHIRITDGKGGSKEYDLSSAAALPIDLLPWIDLLESENGVDEIAQFAEQAMQTWSDDLMRRLTKRHGEAKPWLGVAIQALPEDVAAQLPQLKGAGVVVRDAAPGSPAAAAGLQANDVLFKVNEQILFGEDQLTKLIATYAPGDEVSLTWMRGAEEMAAKTALSAAHPRPPMPQLGPDGAAFIDKQFGPGSSILLQIAASNPEIVAGLPAIRRILKIDEDGNIQWGDRAADEAAAQIRKHLQAHAPDLVPGYDGMMQEMLAEPDLESMVNRLRSELEKATPDMRRRVMDLVGQMAADLMKNLPKE